MAHSLSGACTELKRTYDACFNAWFEGYLRPAVYFSSPSASSSSSASIEQRRAEYSKMKADEYEQSCGKLWTEYKECVLKAVREKGLDQMLAEATKENPLDTPPSPSNSSSS